MVGRSELRVAAVTGIRHRDILTPPFALLLVATVGGFVNLHLLFAVVPKYAAAAGAATVGAGLVTGALMATTVLTQPHVPKLTSRLGYPATLAGGLVLLGGPALLLPLSPALPLVLAVSLLRGVGFGTITVTGSALVAELVPSERHGAGMGAYGVAIGIPGIVALPLGVWLTDQVGYTPVFLAAGAAPLAAVAATLGIRAPRPAPGTTQHGVLAGLRTAKLARPFFVLAAATAATGIVKTFLPLAVPAALGALASAALFAQMTAVTLARALAGMLGDRVGAGRLVAPGALLSAVGMIGLASTGNPVLLLSGAVLFGFGLGVVQTVTLVLMFGRVSRAGYGAVSAQWNIAFDAGTGLGAVAFGVVAGQVGYRFGFVLTAGLLLAASGLALRDRLATRATGSESAGPVAGSEQD